MPIKTIPGGLLIAIEGIDGAGKTTLAARLAAHVESTWKVPVVLSKEPTNGPFGARLRATAATGRLSPQEELELLLADRQEHMRDLVSPALAQGAVVILDRYFYSNMAYQGAAGLDVEDIRQANQAIAPEPQRVLLLDLAPDQGLARIAVRGDAANSFETTSTLTAARRIFLDSLPAAPQGVVIDATQGPDEVFAAALAALTSAAKERLTAAR